MFDARRLLDQVLTSAQSGELGQLAGRFTQPSGTGGTGGASQLVTGALGGGLLGLLVGNKGARKTIGKAGGTALKLGALAAVAALAYTAWQRHKGAGASAPLQLPPAGSGFAPDEAPAGQDSLARGILAALIQGAKADGHIDAQEQARIFDHVGKLDLDPEAKAFVMDELAAPADMARVTTYATSPAVAVELYAASLLAMDPDTAAERAYLDRLARALSLDAGLTREVEQAVADNARASA
jgi:uncharacterized membrane protein YebE (DUF533 family)